MSADHADLRALAEAARGGDKASWVYLTTGMDPEDAAYIAAAAPDRILALLDENEALRRERDEERLVHESAEAGHEATSRFWFDNAKRAQRRAEAAEAERDALRAQGEADRGLDPDALTVCIEHGRFVPCRREVGCYLSQNPHWVKAVRDDQTSTVPGLAWEPASEYARRSLISTEQDGTR